MKLSIRGMVLIAMVIVLAVGFGAVIAHFYKVQSVDNEFQMTKPKVYMNEKFNPKDRWVVGEEKEKQVRFGNQGDMDTIIRVRFDKKLVLEDGTDISDPDLLAGFTLNFSKEFTDHWIHGNDDWYYCKQILKPKEITGVTLNSVTISDQIGNDKRGGDKDYSNAVFRVDVEGQMLQASFAGDGAAQNGWGMIPTVKGSEISWK